jgi:protein TonB
MSMNYAYHWRKAMALSFCLHIFLLVAAGYLTAGRAAPVPVEEMIMEMNLVNDPAERAGNIPKSPVPTEQAAPRPAPSAPTPAEPVQTETVVRPVVTTSDLSMTAAETSAVASSGQPDDAGGTAATASGEAAATSGGMGSGSSQSGIAAPGILSKVDPVYPSTARQAGLEGTVVLRIQILANGRPGEIDVARSAGHPALDEAAVTAVQKWRFVPAKDRTSGRTVACTTTLPISFRLQDHQR